MEAKPEVTMEANPEVQVVVVSNTGCIEGFLDPENCIENAMKIKNPIGKFSALKSARKVKVFPK